MNEINRPGRSRASRQNCDAKILQFPAGLEPRMTGWGDEQSHRDP